MTGLAIVGFIALIVLGLWLAIYSARYVSSVGGGLGSAATYVGSMFEPNPPPTLGVVPAATTTISFGDDTSSSTTSVTSVATTTTTSRSTTHTTPVSKSTSLTPIQYRTITTTYPTPGSTRIQTSGTKTYSGFPDLTVSISAVGYIDSNGKFVTDSTIDHANALAAEILVTNIGTNKTGPWTIEVGAPSSSNASLTHTETMDSLDPNQPVYIDLQLSKGRARIGTDEITVTLDPDHQIVESNENNNSATASIVVQ